MDILKMTALEVGAAIKAKELSAVEAAKAVIAAAKHKDDKIGAYITLCEEKAVEDAAAVQEKIDSGAITSPLAGVPFSIKDNICTKGIKTSCASKILGDFAPVYNATVIERLEAAGAVTVGKLNMDEFAMGSTTETSYYGATKNPWNTAHVPGGSSGGAAAAVAAGEAVCALGSDTGGSIRQPASFCGVVGLKPTYSAVSRYGLIAFASSLDQIGPLTRTVADNALLFDVIAGHDPMDSTSSPEKINYTDYEIGVKGMTIGIPKEFFAKDFSPVVREKVMDAAAFYEKSGAKLKDVSISSFDAALATYYVLACAEASSNLARFDGVKYGERVEGADYIDAYYKSRTAGFGAEVKRRIMIGNYVLSSGYYDAYYLKASKVRTKIKADFDAALRDCDLLLGPTSPTTAFEIGKKVKDVTETYMSDIFTVPVNIAGLPAISIPCGTDGQGLPIGLQLIGRAFGERTLFGAAEAFEKENA